MSLFNELKRRNVLRVGAAYLVGAWLLVQVSATLFPLFALGATAVRNAVILLAIGFIPALIFAWVYELTPGGLKRESELDRSQALTVQTGKKLDRAIMVVLALALGYFAFDKFVLSESREVSIAEEAHQAGRSEALVESYGEKSIAVLPFVDMSSNKDQEYMSDGIAEELLNLLARIPELRVISRSSAFSYKGKDIKLAQVAEELNVAHILEGSVRKAGNQVRITAQLIEARSDTHLWSQTYDRTLDDIFAIQDEIAARVVEQLKVTLLGEAPKIEQTDPEAYALFLQARYLGLQMTARSFEKSNALYEQALLIDPNYAAAWAGLARNCINQAVNGLRPVAEGYPLAREMLQKALALDPNHAPAHARLGYIAMFYDNDLAGAARHIKRALALEPANLDIIGNAASLLVNLGRLDEAITVQQYVTAQDPVNPLGHGNLGWFHRLAGHWEKSIVSNRTTLQLSPDELVIHYEIGVALLFMSEAEAALEEMRQEPSEPFRLAGLAMAHHSLGQTAESDAALEQLIAKYEVEWVYRIATVMAYRNETDRAFDRLAKVVEYHSDGLAMVPIENLFSSLHADPRWLPFLHSIGKSPEQLAAIEFRVTLPK
ncbi:MAG TPA: tetratricopeptide repeat protein [Xanthomonadales bacterium]|nr:tetratricopeptide repeat protein [Xanthomonadales bacterium]